MYRLLGSFYEKTCRLYNVVWGQQLFSQTLLNMQSTRTPSFLPRKPRRKPLARPAARTLSLVRDGTLCLISSNYVLGPHSACLLPKSRWQRLYFIDSSQWLSQHHSFTHHLCLQAHVHKVPEVRLGDRRVSATPVRETSLVDSNEAGTQGKRPHCLPVWQMLFTNSVGF